MLSPFSFSCVSSVLQILQLLLAFHFSFPVGHPLVGIDYQVGYLQSEEYAFGNSLNPVILLIEVLWSYSMATYICCGSKTKFASWHLNKETNFIITVSSFIHHTREDGCLFLCYVLAATSRLLT